MPYYDYECTQCKKNFTAKQTFEDHDRHERVKCPKCGSKKVEQLIVPVMAKTSKKS